MRFVTETQPCAGGTFQGKAVRDDGFEYLTDPYSAEHTARNAVQRWIRWHEGLVAGDAESIYYILAVPHAWPGPPPNAHGYAGLDVKIGRTRNVLKRLANLRTGTTAQLIIHALEPGNSTIERKRHNQFADNRRQGEWFSCSPRLMRHIYAVWRRNNLLPHSHQIEVLNLHQRIRHYRVVRRMIGRRPDLVNPSLDEPWYGDSVFIDLVHALPRGIPRHTGRGKRQEE